MNSLTDFTGNVGCTTNNNGDLFISEIGAKSLTGSNGVGRSRGPFHRVPAATSTVYPSGGDFTTVNPGRIPPPRFSTITGWPSSGEIPCATKRDEKSLLP